MGAFKKFNTQDVYVSTYTAHKNWIVSGSQYSDYGVLNIPAHTGSGAYIPNPININKSYDRRLAFESIRHLYYSSFTDSEILTSSSFDNYLQSSFNVSGSRHLNNIASVYSLPKGIFGTAIKPKSLEITPDGDSEEYVVDGYEDDHIESIGTLYSSTTVFNPNALGDLLTIDDLEPGFLETIVDDGEGNLYLKNRITGEPLEKKVGNVIYPQGQIIITDDLIATYYNNYIDGEIKWKSTQPIYTYNFHCKLKENEFTHTFNPSALNGTNGDVADNVAGEEFSPYFTTIGLYNDSNELIAIAKAGQPIPIPKDTDMTVVVKLDI